MRCPTLLFAGTLFTLVLVGCSSEATDPALASLQGDWRVIGMYDDQQTATPSELEGMRWHIQGAEITAENPDGSSGKMNFTLNAQQSPQAFDVVALSGNMKVVVDPGIYELDANRLQICFRNFDASKKSRPTEMTTDDGCWIMTLEKYTR